jgi:hypothetical protein
VTSVTGLSCDERELLRSMGGGRESSARETAGSSCYDDDDRDIVIDAVSSGLQPARLTIPTSTDRSRKSVLAVAERGAGAPVELAMRSTFE